MGKKNKSDVNGLVYSTDPSFQFEEPGEDLATAAPDRQPFKVRLDHKNRGGKSVTLVEGFIGKEEDLEILGKKLKSYCGTGGAVKNREIIIQGDQREKVWKWLTEQGYRLTRKI